MNQIDELLNNQTLASIEKLEEANFYTPSNMGKKDTRILLQIAKTSVTNIDQTTGALTHLLENLKFYKECMVDSINLQAEEADLASKYATNPVKQSHLLPGVVSTPATYDLQGIKTDNARMEQIKQTLDKSNNQKDLYFRMMSEDFRLFLASYKRLCYSDASFNNFISGINDSISEAY